MPAAGMWHRPVHQDSTERLAVRCSLVYQDRELIVVVMPAKVVVALSCAWAWPVEAWKPQRPTQGWVGFADTRELCLSPGLASTA